MWFLLVCHHISTGLYLFIVKHYGTCSSYFTSKLVIQPPYSCPFLTPSSRANRESHAICTEVQNCGLLLKARFKPEHKISYNLLNNCSYDRSLETLGFLFSPLFGWYNFDRTFRSWLPAYTAHPDVPYYNESTLLDKSWHFSHYIVLNCFMLSVLYP